MKSKTRWVKTNSPLHKQLQTAKFIGGDDTGKITDITDKTGSDYWKNQYVLGDYEITPIEPEVKSLKGKKVSVELDGIKYTATID